jgi:hypothetical protein
MRYYAAAVADCGGDQAQAGEGDFLLPEPVNGAIPAWKRSPENVSFKDIGEVSKMKNLASIALLCSLAIYPRAFAQQLVPITPHAASPIIDAFKSEKEIFEKAHLTPIIIPHGERVGDIYDVNNATLIATAADCFPGLTPQRTASILPQRLIQSEKGLGAALGVADIADANSQIEGNHAFVLDYEDVYVERVSPLQLRNTLVKDSIFECDKVKPFMSHDEAVRKIVSRAPPPLLIGEVFYARRVVHVQTKDKLSGGVQLSFGDKILRSFGLLAKFKVAATDGSSNSFDLVGQQSIPVALSPAFVISDVKTLADGSVEYNVASLNYDNIESQIQTAHIDWIKKYQMNLAVNELLNKTAVDQALSQLNGGGELLSPKGVATDLSQGVAEEEYTRSRQDALYGALYTTGRI